MNKYFPLFEKEEITLESLLSLTEAHLKEMGIPLGPRVRIVNVLKRYQ